MDKGKETTKNKTAVTAEQRLEDIKAMLSSFVEIWKSSAGRTPDKVHIEAYELKVTNAYDKTHRVKGTRQMTEKQSELRSLCFDAVKGVKGFEPNKNTGQKKLGTLVDNKIDYELHIVLKRLDKPTP
jgi:hypothetical protein